jgi:cytochrome P450
MPRQPEPITAGYGGLEESFDPFGKSYLANPYEFFREARTVTPVFYGTKWKYWVVTRYRDIEQIFANPVLFSASNALSALKRPCAAAEQILANGNFRPQPTLTNVDPPAHARMRRHANIAFSSAEALHPWLSEIEFFALVIITEIMIHAIDRAELGTLRPMFED